MIEKIPVNIIINNNNVHPAFWLFHTANNCLSEETSESTGIGHRRNFGVVHFLEGSDHGVHVFTFEPDEGALVAHLVAVVWR